jgi:wyosine [tRNA(Phe)-imidazoG37] synthetase (radical SAM superfamily)
MKLLQAYLDIHSSCNYNCMYCYRGQAGSANTPAGPMELDVFRKLVPVLKKMCWSVSLSCAGEPLLHPDLGGIVEVVNKELARLDVFLVTNGFLLNNPAQDILAESVLSKVSVSVDTVDPALYSRLCGCSPNALATVLSNIESFAKKLRRRRPWPRLFVTAIAMKSTLPLLPDLAKRFCSIGVDGVKIQWLVPWTKSLENKAVPLDAATFDVLSRVGSVLKANRVYFEYPDAHKGEKIKSVLGGCRHCKNKREYLAFSLAKLMHSRRKDSCRLAGTYLSIKKDGPMFACASDNGTPVSFLENTLEDQEQLLKKSIALLRSGQTHEECKACRFFSG